MILRRLAETCVALAVLGLPLVTFLEPATPRTIFETGYYAAPLWGLVTAALILLALGPIWTWDRAAACFVVYLAIWAFVGPPYALSLAVWVAAGAVVASRLARASVLDVRRILVAVAVVQAGLLVLQRLDVWIPLGPWGVDVGVPHGMFGNPRYGAVWLAVAVAVAPFALVPVLFAGLVLSQSYMALLAALLALLARWRTWPMLVTGAGAGVALLLTRPLPGETVWSRIDTWLLAGMDWTGSLTRVVFGAGPGAWFWKAGDWRVSAEVFWHAHNEGVQFLYEFGLVGAGLAAWFLWRRRQGLASPAGLAFALTCLTLSPFRVPSTALAGLAVLAMERPCST